MTIAEKLDILMLSKEERKKAEEKFLATLALISDQELIDINNFLRSKGIQITKAKDIKVFGNSKDEIAKKISILEEIREIDIYKQDPSRINFNVIDIYKKIQYCKQIGKPYKREDGTYETFLFDEALWQQVASRDIDNVANFTQVEEEITAFEPDIAAIENTGGIDDSKYVDINDYMAADNDMKEIEAQKTDFATIRRELEGQLAELDALKSSDMSVGDVDEISFSDLEPESYGGRTA